MCIHYFLIKRKNLFGRPNTSNAVALLGISVNIFS